MSSAARPTMKDVASAAGVSFKTVSRVVNGEPGVSPALRESVTAAIEQLDYQPDHRARALRRGQQRAATIGFIHADMTNPFFGAVHTAFEKVAADNGCLILSGSTHESIDRQHDLVRAFAERRIDGLAVIPVGDAAAVRAGALAHEIARGLPVVFIDREPGLDADVVLSDHRGGARLATEHLLAHGHRRIAFVGSRDHVHSVRERRAGFEAVMSDAGLSPAAMIVGLRTPEDATTAIADLLARPAATRPTALFTAQNGLTLGAVRALHQLDLHRRIALVGFDHIETADIVEPGITTVPQNAPELGRRAGELLFGRLLGGRTESVRETVPVTLIPRGSGELKPSS